MLGQGQTYSCCQCCQLLTLQMLSIVNIANVFNCWHFKCCLIFTYLEPSNSSITVTGPPLNSPPKARILPPMLATLSPSLILMMQSCMYKAAIVIKSLNIDYLPTLPYFKITNLMLLSLYLNKWYHLSTKVHYFSPFSCRQFLCFNNYKQYTEIQKYFLQFCFIPVFMKGSC